MKTLYLLRHAKSSWAQPDLQDFDRPLNERGLADVPLMAARFRQRGSTVDCILASAALRTRSTAALFAQAIDFPAENIVEERGLYFVGPDAYLQAVRGLHDSCAAAMLVGHNPTITEFVNSMAQAGGGGTGGGSIDNIPTCGLVELKLAVGTWAATDFGSAELVEFDYPKRQEA